jgi:adenylyltransferase/sulfurtransferase
MSPADADMNVLDLKARLDADDVPVLVDVREGFERDIADLPQVGQHHIPVGEFVQRHGELSPDDEIVVYCRSGARSGQAVQFLRAQGYERVFNLAGGVLAWQEHVDPSLTRY